MGIPGGMYVYGEWMYAVHSLYYDKLPDYFLVFDIWSEKERRWWPYDEIKDLCWELGLSQVPEIAFGRFSLESLATMVPGPSTFGPIAEGIVVKAYRRETYIRGKVVKPEFIQTLDENDHWTHQQVKENKLAKDG